MFIVNMQNKSELSKDLMYNGTFFSWFKPEHFISYFSNPRVL